VEYLGGSHALGVEFVDVPEAMLDASSVAAGDSDTRGSGLEDSSLGARATILELGTRSSPLAFRRVSELGHGALRTSVRLTQDAGRMGFLRQPNTRVCALPNVLADPDPGRGLVASDVRSQDKRRAPRTSEARASGEDRVPSSSIVTRDSRTELRGSPTGERRVPSSELEYRDPSSELRAPSLECPSPLPLPSSPADLVRGLRALLPQTPLTRRVP
jgi:hypothetical protein